MSPYPPGTDPLLAATIDAAIAAGHITTEDPPTEAEWAAAKGAHQRQLAAVQTNPISKAAFDPTTARDRASLRGVIVVVGRHDHGAARHRDHDRESSDTCFPRSIEPADLSAQVAAARDSAGCSTSS